jgi:hypothetical protein
LLEGQTLGLGNEEVGINEGAGAETTPDEEHRGSQVALIFVNHVGSDDGDDLMPCVSTHTDIGGVRVDAYGVPEPVGGGGETHTSGADREREDLADDDPGTRTPSASKEEDEDGNECDLGVDSGDVVGSAFTSSIEVSVVEADCDTDDGDQELADQHAQCTPDQEWATAELLDSVEGDRGRAYIDQGEDQGDQEGVADGTSRLEKGCRVVEDKVDTSPLLHHLERGTEDGAAQIALLVAETTLEAIGPAGEPPGGWDHFPGETLERRAKLVEKQDIPLIFVVGDDLGNLDLDVLAVDWLSTKSGECFHTLLNAAALDEITRAIGEEEETDAENEAPGELDRDGNAVLAGIVAVLRGIVDAGCEEQTDGDTELVTGNERTTDLTGANLAHVQDDDGGLETDTKTGNETTSNDNTKPVAKASDHLDDDTDNLGFLSVCYWVDKWNFAGSCLGNLTPSREELT